MAALLKITFGEILVYFALVAVSWFGRVVGDSFYRLLIDDASRNAYVDKSMLIKEYLQVQETTVLITRPRRFGKTINIDMLRRFLEIEIDRFGNRITHGQSINRKLFEGGTIEITEFGRKTLEPLKIASEPHVIERRGRYPVILVRFDKVVGRSYKEIERSMQNAISELFREHSRYLKKNNSLDDHDRELFDRYVRSDYTDDMLEQSLLFLTRVLWKHFGRVPVHVLVDDYDRPLRELTANLYRIFRGKFPQSTTFRLFELIFQSGEFNRLMLFLKRILNHYLQENEALAKSLIAGTLPLKLFSDLNSTILYSSINRDGTPLDHFYGFSQNEVDRLFDRICSSFGINREIFRHWFQVYRRNQDAGFYLYSPHTVMECVKNYGKLDYYWSRGLNEYLAEQILLANDMQHVNLSIECGPRMDPGLPFECNWNGINNFLYYIGYLVIDRYFNVPNLEIANTLEAYELKWLRLRLNVTRDHFTRLAKLLVNFNANDFHVEIQSLVERISGHLDEKVFHRRLIRHLELSLCEFYVSEKIRQRGLSKPDLVFISKQDNRSNNAIIIRIKVTQTERNLNTLAKRGLNNLMRLDYDIIRKHEHVDRIMKISMVLYKKIVTLRHGVQQIQHIPLPP